MTEVLEERIQPSKKGKLDNLINSFVDFIFSKDLRKWLILIILLGTILRFIIVPNITPIADEMVHGTHAIGIIGSGAINHQNQSPVWFYLTDIMYKLFGVNSFSARSLSILFGIFLIPLIYLITKKIFNKKVALVASFFWAISAYVIRYSLMEMDLTMLFFVMLSTHYFFKDYLNNKKLSLWWFVFMSIAILTKPIAVIFIPGFVLCFFLLVYYEEKGQRKKILSESLGTLSGGVALSLVFASPVLVYNFLLYRQKGITDIIFSRFFGISQELYQGLAGYNETFSLGTIIAHGPGFLWNTFISLNPLITFLGLAGFIFILFSKNKNAKIFLSLWAIPFIFLLGTSLLQTHFVIFMAPLCIGASFFAFVFSNSIKEKINIKRSLSVILIIIFIVNIYLLIPWITSKSAVFEARDFAISEIGNEDIVVVDSRIYRGRIAFIFHDKHYVEASLFPQITQQLGTMPTSQNIDVYYIECVPDDCGWGTIGNQPEFNKSMEQITDYFKENAELFSSIESGGTDPSIETGKSLFKIYKTTMPLNFQIYSMIDSTHEWFYYPVMWEGERYDSYELYTSADKLSHNFGYIVLWLAIIIALLSPIAVVYEVVRKK